MDIGDCKGVRLFVADREEETDENGNTIYVPKRLAEDDRDAFIDYIDQVRAVGTDVEIIAYPPDTISFSMVVFVDTNIFKFGLDDQGDPLKTNPNTPNTCLLYTSPSPRDRTRSRMPSSA